MSQVFICNMYTHHATFFCEFYLQYWFYKKLVSTECWICSENTGSYIANLKTIKCFFCDELILFSQKWTRRCFIVPQLPWNDQLIKFLFPTKKLINNNVNFLSLGFG